MQPEAIGLQRADSASGNARGVVEGAAFLGDATELIVRTAESTLIVKLTGSDVPAIGDAVTVRIASQSCMLLN